MKLQKTAVKAFTSFLVVISGAFAASLAAPETQSAAVEALAGVPFGQQIAIAVCAGLATALINVVKHFNKPTL